MKLNLTNPWTTIILPWVIILSIFALSWGIWLIVFTNIDPSDVGNASEGMQWSGASTWIFVYMMVIAVQAMNLTFPLALGYGVTRRDFYLGSSLTFVLLSVMYAVGLTILAGIEQATDGWGLGGRMFTAVYFGGPELEWWMRLPIFFFILLFFFFVGAAIATVYVRWKATGLVFFFIILGFALVGHRRPAHLHRQLGHGRRVLHQQPGARGVGVAARADGTGRDRRVLRPAAGDAAFLRTA